jgi:hypothetical protein
MRACLTASKMCLRSCRQKSLLLCGSASPVIIPKTLTYPANENPSFLAALQIFAKRIAGRGVFRMRW